MTSNYPQIIEPTTGCIASALSVLGKKWTALILRDLTIEPKHFCELERSVKNITPRILSQRLRDLEKQGIITNDHTYNSYSLTDKGTDLIPILKQMATWGNKYPR